MPETPVPTIQIARKERWYHSKSFKRFRRNPLAMAGSLLLLGFMILAIFAPILTADQIAERYRGHSCARDLTSGLKVNLPLLPETTLMVHA